MIFQLAPLILSDLDNIVDKKQLHEIESFVPKYGSNVVQDDDKVFTASIDVPGMKYSDLNVVIDNRSIRVSGKKEESSQNINNNKTKQHQQSIRTSTWSKVISLNPKLVEIEKATAQLADGVLTITIPKKPKHTPVPIEVCDDESNQHLAEEALSSTTSFKALTMDTPGVKKADLKVVLLEDGVVDVSGTRTVVHQSPTTSGQKKFRYSKQMHFDPKSVDVTKLQAVLSSGVLTVFGPIVPEREPTIVVVEPYLILSEVETNTKNNYVVSLDVPGTKSTDIIVKLMEDGIDTAVLHIQASRLSSSVNGTTSKKINKKSFTVDSETVDITKFRASLMDGVLTVTAPKKPSIVVPIHTTAAAESNDDTTTVEEVTTMATTTDE